MKNNYKNLVYFSSGALLAASSFVHFSGMIGSYKTYFSCANIIWPLMAFLVPTQPLFGMLSLLAGLKVMGLPFIPLMTITNGIPTLASILSIKAHESRIANFVMHIILPLICITLFILHPTGSQAPAYSAYWLIPIIIFISRLNSVFTQTLASTFVAHAVGSIIWIYTIKTTPEFWIALIPVVALERLVLAGSIAGLVYLNAFFTNFNMPTYFRRLFKNRN